MSGSAVSRNHKPRGNTVRRRILIRWIARSPERAQKSRAFPLTLTYIDVLKQMTQMKNRISGLLMETGVSYNKQRLHKLGYFMELMSCNEEVNESIRPLLKLSRETVVRSQRLDYALVHSLERDPLLAERLKRLRTIPGVGPITALTWALEIGDVSRFQSIKQ